MLETLRSKPKHIKQIISLVLTGVIFSVIVFVWASSKDARSREAEVLQATVSPVGGVTSMFQGMFADFNLKMSGANSAEGAVNATTSTSNKDFELSEVMVIDTAGTTTPKTSTTTRPQ